MSVEQTSTNSQVIEPARDRESVRWVKQLHAGHPRQEQTVQKLQEILRRAAFSPV